MADEYQPSKRSVQRDLSRVQGNYFSPPFHNATVEFDTWEPVYEVILDEFGFDRRADEHAADVLAELTHPFDLDRLGEIEGAVVAIAGAGPSLSSPDSVDRAREADVVIAASTAADVLLDSGVEVHCMVTDLDKNPETVRTLTEAGVPVAVHAHGDNVEELSAVVPACRKEFVLPTTQAEPVDHVRNFGGFTDGDRAAFLAHALGANSLTFVGWDLDDPAVDPIKATKLEWAERLLHWLESIRGERFDVLDGRRSTIERPI